MVAVEAPVAETERVRRIPMPLGEVKVHCWGWLKNGRPCFHILFSGTVVAFHGVQRIKCPKCYKITELE